VQGTVRKMKGLVREGNVKRDCKTIPSGAINSRGLPLVYLKAAGEGQ